MSNFVVGASYLDIVIDGLRISGAIASVEAIDQPVEYIEINEMGRRESLKVPTSVNPDPCICIMLIDSQVRSGSVDENTEIVELLDKVYITNPYILELPAFAKAPSGNVHLRLEINFDGTMYSTYEDAAAFLMENKIKEANDGAVS